MPIALNNKENKKSSKVIVNFKKKLNLRKNNGNYFGI